MTVAYLLGTAEDGIFMCESTAADGNGTSYYIYRTANDEMLCAKDAFCGLRCGQCDFCIHQYSCTCPAFVVIGINSCKHIHLLGRYLLEERNRAGDAVGMEMEAQSDDCLVRELEVTTRVQEQTEKKKRKADDSIRYREEMKRQLAVLSNTVGDSAGVSHSLWSAFNSFKAQVVEEFAQTNSIRPVGDEPLASNSVVVKQKRLFATQKKHRKQREPTFTSEQEREEIIESLFDVEEYVENLENAQVEITKF
ncbi:MAG: hypothetical protein GY696_22350, partial [Gammaproteobacteria bacterium]|nr:hypothetical protein [Gammaproteobacteria bacterium]